MKKFFFNLIALIAICGFVACNKNEEVIGNTNVTNEQQVDNTLKNLAKSLAASTKSFEVRNFIRNEVLKKFDGDNNFLLSECIGKSVLLSKGNLKSAVSGNFGEIISEEDLSTLLGENPLLQIAVPFCDDYEDFDWETEEPLVAFLPEDFDEATTDYLDAYDSGGNLFRLDARDLPEKPVIVISRNERVIAVSKTGVKSSQIDSDSKPFFENESYQYFFKKNISCLSNSEETSATVIDDMNKKATGGATSIYNRDKNNNKDILSKAKFVDKNAARRVEGWPNGNPEFRIIVAYLSREGTSATIQKLEFYPSDTGWIKKKFFTISIVEKSLNYPVLTWYSDRFGRDMLYQWIEEDGGTSVEFSINLSSKFKDTTLGGSLKITKQQRDENAGSALVQYEDATTGEGTMYSTGIVNFWVRQ